MIDLRLTNQEAIELENDLDLLRLLLNPSVASDEKLKLLDRPMRKAVLSAHDKLNAELDNLAEAQRRLIENSQTSTQESSMIDLSLTREEMSHLRWGIHLLQELLDPRVPVENKVRSIDMPIYPGLLTVEQKATDKLKALQKEIDAKLAVIQNSQPT